MTDPFHLGRSQAQRPGQRGQLPGTFFASFQIHLADDVGFASRARQTKGLVVTRSNRFVDGKLEFDGLVELGVEFYLANVTMGGSRNPAKRFDELMSRGSAVRTKNLPTKVQEAASGCVEEQCENIPRVGMPFFCDCERTDVSEFDIGRFSQELFERSNSLGR